MRMKPYAAAKPGRNGNAMNSPCLKAASGRNRSIVKKTRLRAASGRKRCAAKKTPFFSVSPAAAVFYPLLFLFLSDGELAALLFAAGIHELGHLLALALCGIPPIALRWELFGLCMETPAPDAPGKEALCALTGPLVGLAAAFLLPRSAWGKEAAALSALLSLFNLLPVPILDGGRALSALGAGGRTLRAAGIAASLALFGLALWNGALPAAGTALWLLRAATEENV